MFFTLFLALSAANDQATNYSNHFTTNVALTTIKEANGVKQSYVDNKTFLISGGEFEVLLR